MPHGCMERICNRFANINFPQLNLFRLPNLQLTNPLPKISSITAAICSSNTVNNFSNGLTSVLSLPDYLKHAHKAKETKVILKQAAINTLSYAALPFFYFSALEPRLKESIFQDTALATTVNVFMYGACCYLFVRRLFDYTIDIICIPHAVNCDQRDDQIKIFSHTLSEGLAPIYSRIFANQNQSLTEALQKKLYQAMVTTPYKNIKGNTTKQLMIKNLENNFYEIFKDGKSKIASINFPVELSMALSQPILYALDSTLIRRRKNINLFDKLHKKFQENLFKSIQSATFDTQNAHQLSLQTLDQIALAARQMELSIPNNPYNACGCDFKIKTSSIIRSPFYFLANIISLDLFGKIINYFYPNLLATSALFILKSLLYGESLLEYKLAASGICVDHRYDIFGQTNFFSLGFGISQFLLTKAITFPLTYFYGVNSFFIDDAIANMVLQYHLISLLIDNKPLPKDRFSLDISRYPRKAMDVLLNKTVEKLKVKLIKLNDEEARKRAIKRIKTVLNNRPLNWAAGLMLGPPSYFTKFINNTASEQDLYLLNILFDIPSMKYLLKTFEPSISSAINAVEWVCYFSFVLSSPLLQRNPLLFLLMPNVVISILSLPVHILKDKGFVELINQIAIKVSNANQEPFYIGNEVYVRYMRDDKRIANEHESDADKRTVVKDDKRIAHTPEPDANKQTLQDDNRIANELQEAIESELSPQENKLVPKPNFVTIKPLITQLRAHSTPARVPNIKQKQSKQKDVPHPLSVSEPSLSSSRNLLFHMDDNFFGQNGQGATHQKNSTQANKMRTIAEVKEDTGTHPVVLTTEDSLQDLHLGIDAQKNKKKRRVSFLNTLQSSANEMASGTVGVLKSLRSPQSILKKYL